jgi:pimeloyl-ACP methyl ester carboxylesterase
MARRRTGYYFCSPGPHPPGELTPRSPVPELTYLVPIIGAPDYGALLAARAAKSGLGALRAPHWPRALDALVRAGDPVHAPPGAWAGKRVLAVCGGRDELVPPSTGGTEAFVERLHEAGVDAALQVDAEAGHEVTSQMVGWVAEWLFEKALRPTLA